MGNLNFIKDVIYGLKMDMGQQIYFGSRIVTENLETGVRASTNVKFLIPNGIYLPINLRHQFLKQVGIHREGHLEFGNREILVDKSEIPTGKEIKIEHGFAEIKGKTGDIVSVDDYDHALIVVVKEIKGLL